jgi:hypothetical protein
VTWLYVAIVVACVLVPLLTALVIHDGDIDPPRPDPTVEFDAATPELRAAARRSLDLSDEAAS